MAEPKEKSVDDPRKIVLGAEENPYHVRHGNYLAVHLASRVVLFRVKPNAVEYKAQSGRWRKLRL